LRAAPALIDRVALDILRVEELTNPNRIGMAEAVNRLVIVSSYAKRCLLSGRKEAQQSLLKEVHVLVFVNDDVVELSKVISKRIVRQVVVREWHHLTNEHRSMVAKPSEDLLLKLFLGRNSRKARMVVGPSCPASFKSTEHLAAIPDVAERSIKVAKHEIAFIFQEGAWRALCDREHGVTLEEPETVGVESRRADLIRAIDPQVGDLGAEIMRRGSSERNQKYLSSGNAFL